MSPRLELRPVIHLLCDSHTQLAAHCCVTRRTVERWCAEGLSIENADRIAVMFGFHPSEIWSDWWNIDPDEPA